MRIQLLGWWLFLAWISSAGWASDKSSHKPFEMTGVPIIQQARDLLDQEAYEACDKLLSSWINDVSAEIRPPYVKDETLYLYATNIQELAAFSLIHSASPAQVAEMKRTYYPWYDELYQKAPWTNVSKVEPSICQAYYLLSYSAIQQNQRDRAIELLKKSVKVWPWYTEGYAQLVYLYIQNEEYQKAKSVAFLVLRKFTLGDHVNRAALLRHLGYIYGAEGDIESAARYYKTSLKFAPNNENALSQLKNLLLVHTLKQLQSQENSQNNEQ